MHNLSVLQVNTYKGKYTQMCFLVLKSRGFSVLKKEGLAVPKRVTIRACLFWFPSLSLQTEMASEPSPVTSWSTSAILLVSTTAPWQHLYLYQEEHPKSGL